MGAVSVVVYKGFIRNPTIGNTLSEFCPISEDWGESGVPKLERMSLMTSY